MNDGDLTAKDAPSLESVHDVKLEALLRDLLKKEGRLASYKRRHQNVSTGHCSSPPFSGRLLGFRRVGHVSSKRDESPPPRTWCTQGSVLCTGNTEGFGHFPPTVERRLKPATSDLPLSVRTMVRLAIGVWVRYPFSSRRPRLYPTTDTLLMSQPSPISLRVGEYELAAM